MGDVIALGEVADGADDVEAADPPCRGGDDHQGEEDAEGVADDEAAARQRVAQLEAALGGEGLADHLHHHEGDPDAEDGADGGGEQVIGRPLVEERLHEVAPLGADGAGHAHLGPALGGQHHEDQEDQQDARRHREAAEGGEELDEGVARLVGGLEPVLLGWLGAEAESGDGLVEGRLDGVGGVDTAGLPAGVGHEHVVGLAGAVEEVAGGGEGQEHGGAVGRGAAVAADTSHLHLEDLVPGEHDDGVARLGGELVGGVVVEEDGAGSEVGDLGESELGSPGGVGSEEGDPGLGAAAGFVLRSDRLDDGGGHPVHRQRRRHAVDGSYGVVSVEVGAGGVETDVDRAFGVGAGGDGLVGDAEGLHDHRPHRRREGVASEQRGGDDRRAEHQAEDDEGAAGAPARDVAQPHPQEHDVARREHGDDAHREEESDGQSDRERAGGQAEHPLHRRLLRLGAGGDRRHGQADLVALAARR